jgi:hypothetical protein
MLALKAADGRKCVDDQEPSKLSEGEKPET